MTGVVDAADGRRFGLDSGHTTWEYLLLTARRV
jgi:hypothetical protein